MIEIQINGDERELGDGTTLAELLTEVGANRGGVAVAVDGEVVSRGRWPEVVLDDGAKIEVLTAVQGG